MVAFKGSLTAAAVELNLTKGAISHQLRTLEEQLGFRLFDRLPRGVALTQKGEQLFHAARAAFGAMDRQIDSLREDGRRSVTLGLSTYLASRWLSPKLMGFLQAYPAIRLRVQPMIDLYDLERDGIDIAIRWGKGDWTDIATELLFGCPAFPVGAPSMLRSFSSDGLAATMARASILHDRDGSSAWADWFAVADLRLGKIATNLTIPDPNVRVQAVIDGQGIALFDLFINSEMAEGKLQRLSAHTLDDYGYYLSFPPGSMANPDVATLAHWLKRAASETQYSDTVKSKPSAASPKLSAD